jgi:hypothetical protein
MRAYKIISVAIVSIMLCVSGCEEIVPFEDIKPLNPVDQDFDVSTTHAKDWTMIILASNNQFPSTVPAPLATNDPKYVAELDAIKDAQSKLTDSQREAIKYWSAGGVIRWNQIMRGLVARFALPPAPKADGTYPIPDAENPFGDPAFPFANPPYDARAYSYLSVAQYEALKSAWYYKELYQRPAPYAVDNTIQALVPESNLPAYPSEDAVISGVTAEMLKVLFPAAVEEITLKAAEQRNAALWSGKAASSDISAGLALGKAVAGFITAPGTGRFRTDGMGAAGGDKAKWAVLIDSAKLHYTKYNAANPSDTRDISTEIFWKSLDTPARPPMLPFFGNVKGWFMSPAQFATERTNVGPPPSTSSDLMKTEVAEVKKETDKMDREKLRIVHYWADGAGTYAPPGHWNHIAEDYIIKANFSEVRAARAYAYLNTAIHDAGVGCWNVKFYWYNPRPTQLDPDIKTFTGMPNFPSYLSGHSTFSAAAAEVLSYLFPDGATTFDAMKEEAAISRLYGGIHYRSDIEKGKTLGQAIGVYTRTYAQADGAD